MVYRHLLANLLQRHEILGIIGVLALDKNVFLCKVRNLLSWCLGHFLNFSCLLTTLFLVSVLTGKTRCDSFEIEAVGLVPLDAGSLSDTDEVFIVQEQAVVNEEAETSVS